MASTSRTGKSLILFVFVAVVGAGAYVACGGTGIAPKGEGCPSATGTSHVFDIAVDVANNQIAIDPPHVHVMVDQCDQIIWASTDTTNFSVSLEHKRGPSGPPNPFPGTFTATGSQPVTWEAVSSSIGALASGPAVQPAKGRLYKFTITATVNGKTIKSEDPHVFFY